MTNPERIEAARQTLLDSTATIFDIELAPSNPRSFEDEFPNVSHAPRSSFSLAWLADVESVGPEEGRILAAVATSVGTDNGNREPDGCTILELGTSVGIGTCYLSSGAALGWRVVSVEAGTERLHVARGVIAEAGCDGSIELVHRTHDEFLRYDEVRLKRPIAMVFLDGDHRGAPTLAYVRSLLAGSALSPDGCVIVMDDIDWSPGMAECWRRVSEEAQTAGISVATVGRFGLLGTGLYGNGERWKSLLSLLQ